jgi:hypothetical protein
VKPRTENCWSLSLAHLPDMQSCCIHSQRKTLQVCGAGMGSRLLPSLALVTSIYRSGTCGGCWSGLGCPAGVHVNTSGHSTAQEHYAEPGVYTPTHLVISRMFAILHDTACEQGAQQCRCAPGNDLGLILDSFYVNFREVGKHVERGQMVSQRSYTHPSASQQATRQIWVTILNTLPRKA